MERGLREGKLTVSGLRDVEEAINIFECYKDNRHREPRTAAEFFDELPVEDVLEQCIESDDFQAEWAYSDAADLASALVEIGYVIEKRSKIDTRGERSGRKVFTIVF